MISDSSNNTFLIYTTLSQKNSKHRNDIQLLLVESEYKESKFRYENIIYIFSDDDVFNFNEIFKNLKQNNCFISGQSFGFDIPESQK